MILHHFAPLSSVTSQPFPNLMQEYTGPTKQSWTALLGLKTRKSIPLSFLGDDLHKKKAIILALWMPCHKKFHVSS